MGLDGLVVIGGDDSNTNAALLGEYFKASVRMRDPLLIAYDSPPPPLQMLVFFASTSRLLSSPHAMLLPCLFYEVRDKFDAAASAAPSPCCKDAII